MAVKSDNQWLSEIAGLGGTPLTKTMTFAGGTTNDPGDYDGTGNPATLFTVTGVVAVKLFAVVGTTLVGASATVAVGVSGSTAALIASTTATNAATGEIWHDATPDATVELSSIATEKIVTGNIIQTVGTANITAGVLRYYLWWKPLSPNGNVVAA
jgi:hypothetical protein